MEKEIIRQNILDYREILVRRTFIPRDIEIDHSFARRTGKVIAIVGPRRAGKSTTLLQVAAELALPAGARIHVDFSEITWSGFQGADPLQWRALYEVGLEFSDEPVFLMDEIQELSGWAAGLIFLLDRGCRVIVTGSNRAVFSEGLASSLRGKVLQTPLYPLSFREYLRFRNAAFREPLTSIAKARRHELLLDYLGWGGFPEVVPAPKEELVKRVLMSFTKDISINRWYNDLKSRGLRVSKDTLYEYVDYLQEAQFLLLVDNLSAPQGARKAYLIDNGYYRRVQVNPDTGKLLENRVCLDLSADPSLRFYRDEKGEVDFVTGTRIIQACTELNSVNAEREWAPLRLLHRRFPDREAGVITVDTYPDPVMVDS